MKQIAIIGAGISGLTLSYELKKQGIQSTIFEARKRVGGRILSAKINDSIVELGGQNICDGGEGKTILRLAKELNLSIVDSQSSLHLNCFYKNRVYDVEAPMASYFKKQKNLKEKLKEFAKDSSSLDEVISHIEKEDPIVAFACRCLLSSYEGAEAQYLSSINTDILYFMLSGGLSSAHHSVDNAFIMYKWIEGGNSRLIEALEENLKDSIKLGYPLIKVIKGDDASIHLFFRNGERVKTDIVVFSNPLCTYSDIEISSEIIPSKLQKLYQTIVYGQNSKILVPYKNHPFNKRQFSNGKAVIYGAALNDIATIYCCSNQAQFTSNTVRAIAHSNAHFLKELDDKIGEVVLANDEVNSRYSTSIGYSWVNHPYTKGSYSCVGIGNEEIYSEVQSINDAKFLSAFAPINRQVFFAGEHTTTQPAIIGTMEAAALSGDNCAKLIANCCA